MSNKHCGPDIVKYFVVEPTGSGGVITGSTGNFFVCSGTTFLSTISGCTNGVDFNGNTFYNNSDVFFNGVITACTGIHTSNIYGCSPITVHDELILLNKLTLSAVTQDDTLTQILGRDSSTGEVKYRSVESIITGATSQDTFVTGGTFNDTLNELTLKRNDSVNIVISGFSSGAQFGTTYFVAPEGNDLTGEYGNISKPFKTITGARNQLLVDSLSGQTLIYVFPGTYDEAELQYPNGKMYLSPGSLIKPSAKINGVGAAMTAVNQGTKTFTFNGNWADNLVVGNKFLVIGGANAGTYTISLATNVVGTTEVLVLETIPSPSVGGILRTNESIITLGKSPLNAPLASTSNNFEIYGEGDIEVVKSLDNDWSDAIISLYGTSELYAEATSWRQEQGVLIFAVEDSKLTFNGSNLELYGGGGYVASVRDSSDTTFNFDRITCNGDFGFFVRYGSNPTFDGSCVVTANVLKGTNNCQTLAIQRMGAGGRVVINSPIIETESWTLNSTQHSGGEAIINGNIFATTVNGKGIVAGLDSTGAKFTINGNITTDANTAFLGVGGVNSDWYFNGNIESLSGSSANPLLNFGSGSGSVNLNGSVKNTDGGTTLDGISTGGVSIIVENLDVVADNETITSSSPQTVEILHSLNINCPLSPNITTNGLFNYTGTTNVGDLIIYNTPTNDDSLTQILGRNSTTGDIEYRDVNSIIGAASADTFTTGFTYNNANTLTISDNAGDTFSTSINIMTGLTVTSLSGVNTIQDDGGELTIISDDFKIKGDNVTIQDSGGNDIISIDTTTSIPELSGEISFIDNQTFSSNVFVNNILTATTISATTYFGDGSNLTGIPDNFVSGGTYNSGTNEINFVGNSSETNFDVDLTSLVSSVSGDTFVVSGNADAATSLLTFTNNSGGTFNVTNSAALFSDNDINVTGGTYNPSNGCITFVTNSGTTFDVCGFVTGFTDSYTTDAYLSGTEVRFDNSVEGVNYYNVDLNPLLSGKTDNTTFNTYTANTQTILDGKIDSVNNVGGANEFFKDKVGTAVNFRTLSGGSNTTVSTVGDVVKVDVTIPPATNTFVTGFTYNDTNTFTISRNDGVDLSTSINTMTGLTVNGTISATTYFGDGSNLTGISTDDNFVTGGTLNSGTLILERQNGTVIITGFTTDLDTYVTGGTVSISATDSDNSGTIGLFYKNSDGIPRTLPFKDTFVTGGTYNNGSSTIEFTKNDSTTFNVDLSSIDVNDTFSTGGTVTQSATSGSTDVTIQITGNQGFTPYNITGLTDTFVNDFSFSSNTFTISQNDGSTFEADVDTIDLANILSGVTFDIATSGSISATTFNGGTFNGTFVGDGSGLTGITDNDTFVTGTTFSSNQAILSRNDGFEVFKFSGGSNVNLSNPSTNEIKIDVSLPSTMNTFTTGFTYNNANTFTITDNDSGVFNASINTVTGLTVNGTLSATTYFGDGSNLTGISSEDNFVTGGTFSSETLTLNRQNGTVTITGFTSTPNLNDGEIFVGNTGNTAQSVAMTGDVNIDNTGLTTIQPDVVTYDKMQDVTQRAILGSENVSGGTVTEIPVVDQFLSTGTVPSQLSNTSNWDINGNYTGSTISGTFQSQMYYDGNYFFIAVLDNVWIRLIRG